MCRWCFRSPLVVVLAFFVSILLIEPVHSQPEIGFEFRVDFEEMEIGAHPLAFSTALTGGGGPAQWTVATDTAAAGDSKILVQQSAENVSDRFPLCIFENFIAEDVELSVRFRPVSGEIDQAAGLVWRYQDANNYYVVRANALEDNVVLYKVEDGERNDLKPVGAWFFAYGTGAEVPANDWSMLSVIVRGNRFSVSLNGDHLFDVEDDTFAEDGKVGLWTKADSVTQFDDLFIKTVN